MYIVAGVVTILWSGAIYFFMPPDPVRYKGFTDRERYIAIARLQVNNAGVRNTHFNKAQALELLADVKFWIVFSASFLIQIANGPISTFLPISFTRWGLIPSGLFF